VAGGTANGTVLLWNRADHWRQATVLTGPPSPVDSVAFSPGGAAVAGGTANGTVLLWNRASRHLLGKPLTGYSGPVDSVAFSPDGKIPAHRSFDRTMTLWDVTTPAQDLPGITTGLVPYLCALAGQPLTRAEWEQRAQGVAYLPICPPPLTAVTRT
jgi:WD40 repeat protein